MPTPIPPEKLIAALAYLNGLDHNGDAKILDQPGLTQQSILVWDGFQLYWADGSDDRQVNLPNLANHEAGLAKLVGCLATGRLVAVTGPGGPADLTTRQLVQEGEHIYWRDVALREVPTGVNGLLFKVEADIPADGFHDVGVVRMDNNGFPHAIGYGTENQILTMRSGLPEFRDPSTGAIGGGSGGEGISGVTGRRISTSVVNMKANRLTLRNGAGAAVEVTGVNVNADLANPVGVNGLDAGAENASTWYYGWVITDGVTVSGLISTNGTFPTLPGVYTHAALATVFRNDNASNIVDYYQRGRKFWLVPQVWGNDLNISNTLQPIISGTALSTILPPVVSSFSGMVGGSMNEGQARPVAMASSATGIGLQFVGSAAKDVGGETMENFKFDKGSFYDLPILDPIVPAAYWESISAILGKRRIVVSSYQIL